MFLAGERCDHETLHWVQDRFKVPCLDHWWQTGMHCVAVQKLNCTRCTLNDTILTFVVS